MSALAKTNEKSTTLRYFVEEQMVASPLLLLVLGAMAAIGVGDAMMDFANRFYDLPREPEAGFALLVGLFYAGLCICTTFDLSRSSREHFLRADALRFQYAVGRGGHIRPEFYFQSNPPSASQLVKLRPDNHGSTIFSRRSTTFNVLWGSSGLRSPTSINGCAVFVIGTEKPDPFILGETTLAPERTY
jgi:hypothetical protein